MKTLTYEHSDDHTPRREPKNGGGWNNCPGSGQNDRERLGDAAIAAKVDGQLVDLSSPLEKNAQVSILTEKDPESLEIYRHSSAHLLALAVIELFPGTQLGVGPAIIMVSIMIFTGRNLSLRRTSKRLRQKMQELISRNLPYLRVMVDKTRALNSSVGWARN